MYSYLALSYQNTHTTTTTTCTGVIYTLCTNWEIHWYGRKYRIVSDLTLGQKEVEEKICTLWKEDEEKEEQAEAEVMPSSS